MRSYTRLAEQSESVEQQSQLSNTNSQKRTRRLPIASKWQEMRSEDQRMLFILTTVGLFIILLVGALLKQGSARLISETAGLTDNSVGLFDIEVEKPGNNGLLSPVFTKEVHHWDSDIVRWASLFKLDPNMVATVMHMCINFASILLCVHAREMQYS